MLPISRGTTLLERVTDMLKKPREPLASAKVTPVYEHAANGTVRIDGNGDVASSLFFVGESPVFLLPPDMLSLQGAHRFTEDHPFVKAIADGPSVLDCFYRDFSPRNLAEMYRLAMVGLQGEDLAPWELPWLSRNRKPPAPEVGLGIKHGVSYYGPCTPQKVAAEYDRLVSVTSSIRESGYLPEKHGHIEGHFFRSGKKFVFFVRGGKHRAAALTFLGFDRVPVRIRLTWPRVIVAGTEVDWPLVQSGEIDRQLAARVFNRYFDHG